jgi:DNA adenine methylase
MVNPAILKATAHVDLPHAAVPMAPPLKWAGGKRWLVPILAPLWARYRDRRLVEPFCGGLAVALGLRPTLAMLNDINGAVIHFYRHLQAGLDIDIPMENDDALYYAHRARFNTLIQSGAGDSREAASLFYYLNRTGYNGLCRFNSRGEFNVPFGKYKTIRYERDFEPYRSILAAWTFTIGAFERIELHTGDFVYADPPYDVEFVHYAKEPFGWAEQVRLVDWLLAHDGPVALSNQATPRIVALYEKAGFSLMFMDAPRRINSTGDRTPAREVLALRGIGL